MKTVIVVNGKPRSGKDTLISLMRDALSAAEIQSTAYSSIDPVKEMLREYVDLRAKTEADRKLLSIVGDAMQEHSQFRTGRCAWMIDDFFHDLDHGVFFLHMREPELIERMRTSCQEAGIRFISVLLHADRAENVTSNPSDAGVENGVYDAHLTNNGTLEDLATEAAWFVKDRLL